MLANLSSNQYYRGLNRRFDKRYAFLHRLGFRPNESGQLTRKSNWGRKACIDRAILSHASNYHWRVMLGDTLNRF
jgi:hypothetical protein